MKRYCIHVVRYLLLKKIKCVCRGGGEKRCIQRIKKVIIFFNAKKTKIIVSNKISLECVSLRGKNYNR